VLFKTALRFLCLLKVLNVIIISVTLLWFTKFCTVAVLIAVKIIIAIISIAIFIRSYLITAPYIGQGIYLF
jgi:hypothetical protein